MLKIFCSRQHHYNLYDRVSWQLIVRKLGEVDISILLQPLSFCHVLKKSEVLKLKCYNKVVTAVANKI